MTTQPAKRRKLTRVITPDWRTEKVPPESVAFAAKRCGPCLRGWSYTGDHSIDVLMASCYLQACEDVVQALEACGVDLSVLGGAPPVSQETQE
jgi:hypothetical protein